MRQLKTSSCKFFALFPSVSLLALVTEPFVQFFTVFPVSICAITSQPCTSGRIGMSRLFSSVQFSSVTQSCPTLCDPMNCSTPGLPVHHQLPEFIQTHVHRVSDAIQPSHPLSSPSPPAPNPSQHQGLFQ